MTMVQITCLCGLVNEMVRLRDHVPVLTTACHCNTCRYTTGSLFYSVLPIQNRPDSVSSLRSYQTVGFTRYFCGICGTHVCVTESGTDIWKITSGVVDRVIGNEQVSGKLEQIASHQFVGDTVDGGFSVLLTGTNEKSAECYLQACTGQTLSAEQVVLPTVQTKVQDQLDVACHCGGVQFFLTRPTWASSSENPDDAKWWITSNDKYMAGTCACRSCRLSLGSPIMTWAFVPKTNMYKKDGQPLDYDMGSLCAYESSKGVSREFCSTCGATVFWHSVVRPDLVDVSVGLLRAPCGARAESWLDWWTERVSFSEDAVDHDLIDVLRSNLPKLNKLPLHT